MYTIGYPLLAVIQILDSILFLYTLLIIASAIVSWLRPDPYHPAIRILHKLTEPVYNRIRRYIPKTSQLDLAPLVALLAIMFIQQGILPIFNRIAEKMING